MMDQECYYIATENYSDGDNVDVSVGNQYKLVENVDEEYVKLRPVESSSGKCQVVVVPRAVVEFMSLPSQNPPSLALPRSAVNPLLRSHSAMVKERTQSMVDQLDTGPAKQRGLSTFGHSPTPAARGQPLSVSLRMSKSVVYDRNPVVAVAAAAEVQHSDDLDSGDQVISPATVNDGDYKEGDWQEKVEPADGPGAVLMRGSHNHQELQQEPENGDQNWVRQSDEAGNDVYVHPETGERWRATKDESGRQYFYEENKRISLWNLPSQDKSSSGAGNVAEDIAVRALDEVLEGAEEDDDDRQQQQKDGVNGGSHKDILVDNQDEDEDGGSWTSDDEDQPAEPSPTVSLDCSEEAVGSGGQTNNKFNIRKIRKEHISGPLENKLMRTEKAGTVEKAKVMENNKELPHKKLSKFHMVLTGPELFFYKDAKAAQSKPGLPHGRVELRLKMQNLEFSEPPIYGQSQTSPPDSIVVVDRGAPGSSIVYLLKFSSSEECARWLTALDFARNLQIDNRYSDKSSKLVLTPDKRLVETSVDEEPIGDKQNIKFMLSKFLRKRPNADSLEARGILKPEAVFGSSLEILCDQERSKIPEFVYRSILAIEARGLSTNGIYRISGNQAKIQKLRLTVDDNRYQLNSDDVEFETLTGAFKLFFKELREPLLDDEFCNKMSEILASRRPDKRNPYKDINMNAARKLVTKMRPSHYEASKALFGHLNKVVAHSSKNLMDVANISMVWGPNLYHTSGKATTKLAVLLMTRNQIVDLLIHQYQQIFDPSAKK